MKGFCDFKLASVFVSALVAASAIAPGHATAQSSSSNFYFSPEVAYVLPVDGEVDDTIFLGGRVGMGAGDGFSFELEGGWAEYGFDATDNAENIDVTTIPVLANLRFGPGAKGDNVGWYGYAGAGWSFNEIEDNNLNTEADDSFIWQLGAGAEYPLSSGTLAFLDIRYLWNRADLAGPGVIVNQTDDDIVLTSVMFTVGLRF